MNEMLIIAPFVIGKKSGGIFKFYSTPKKPGNFIFRVEMKIGNRQIMPAINAQKFLLRYQPVSAGNT
jgi:hypothetical protein